MSYGPNLLGSNVVSDSNPFVITASSSYPDASIHPFKAFDGQAVPYVGTWWANDFSEGNHGWLKVDFGAGNAKKIARYTGVLYFQNEYCPDAWTFEGSNDDTNWTVLDTRTNQAQFWNTMPTYDFANGTAYRYYRINFTDTGAHGRMAVMEITMHEAIIYPSVVQLPDMGHDTMGYQADYNNPYLVTSDTAHPQAPAWYLFKPTTEQDHSSADGYGVPHWIKVDFCTGNYSNISDNQEAISRYSILSKDSPTCRPDAWVFEASNDDTNWVTLDTQTGRQAIGGLVDYYINNTTKYRYYRLRVTAGNPSRTSIQHIYLYAYRAPNSILHDGIASASNGANPEAAVDGVYGTEGSSWGTDASWAFPKWWKYDLGVGVSKVVTKLRIMPWRESNTIRDFKLQGSNNDADWTDVYTGACVNTGNPSILWQTFDFSNTAAYRYYRILFLNNGRGDGGYISMHEVEMYTPLHRPVSPMITSFND